MLARQPGVKAHPVTNEAPGLDQLHHSQPRQPTAYRGQYKRLATRQRIPGWAFPAQKERKFPGGASTAQFQRC